MTGATSMSDSILAVIASTSVGRQLARRPAVVLERLARGGGATRWYFIDDPGKLSELAGRLAPASCVSFYFDGRIERQLLDDNTVDIVLNLVDAHGEAVVGVLSTDQLLIDVDFVAGLGDLSEFLGPRLYGVELFIGAFPARDDDGVDAVTVDLPDRDGFVRRHPH